MNAGCCISALTRASPPGSVLAACTLNHWSMTSGLSLKCSAKASSALARSASNSELTSTARAVRRSVMLSQCSNCSRVACSTCGLPLCIRYDSAMFCRLRRAKCSAKAT
ncbi:hypothetical protein D3C75_756370 [compost metagenome]